MDRMRELVNLLNGYLHDSIILEIEGNGLIRIKSDCGLSIATTKEGNVKKEIEVCSLSM